MKHLRRITALALCVILSLFCAFTVCAENIKYNLKDLKMSISIPDTFTVKTRENSSDLSENIYLEAVSADNTVTIAVAMIKNDKTQEIYSFENLSYSDIEAYKDDLLQNGEYIECKEGKYGDVPFLDFSQKYKTNKGVEIYGKQSITLINGMNISITSQSAGDNFTSDELTLIKGCLESIRFTQAKTAESTTSFWKIFLWIVVALLLLAIAFFVFSYYMGKRNAERKREALREQRRKADYDVLSRAESRNKPQSPEKLGGYKSSSDYFETGFDSQQSAQRKSTEPSQAPSRGATEKAVRSTKKAFTHAGYFLSNVKRELKKSKAKKKTNQSKKSKASAKNQRKPRDYDVFSDK